MATMIPFLDPTSIENAGEKMFYEAASELPADFTVLYSYKYKIPELGDLPEQVREADFVIVHPAMGFLVVEVKGGEVAYRDGCWCRAVGGVHEPLRKNPADQARAAMYAILDRYKAHARKDAFPQKLRFAVSFPQCHSMSGVLPADLDENSIFLAGDLYNLEEKIRLLFGDARFDREATNLLLNKVLAPTFQLFSRLDEQIELFNLKSERILSEEQERILEETELNKRGIFFGAAGTGKTFLALEKAKRLDSAGRKVLLTCFNKNLAAYFITQLPASITSANFHDLLLRTLQDNGLAPPVPGEGGLSLFFDKTLPELAFDYFMTLPEDKKFDAVIVDEGQDFQEEWISCLEGSLKTGGELYIFADPSQSVFNRQTDYLYNIPVSRHRLTRNLRNTGSINSWLCTFLQENRLRSSHQGGLPVGFFTWDAPGEEKRLVEREVGRLVSQGLQPKRIVILSPNVREKSSLAGLDKIREWPLADYNDTRPNALRFATIRSFKGLEADIVFLIGVREGRVCTPTDIYVGASRARFLLNVFHDKSLFLDEYCRIEDGA